VVLRKPEARCSFLDVLQPLRFKEAGRSVLERALKISVCTPRFGSRIRKKEAAARFCTRVIVATFKAISSDIKLRTAFEEEALLSPLGFGTCTGKAFEVAVVSINNKALTTKELKGCRARLQLG
jgi:hypothetical protein